jgi:hypothetical protein
MSDARFGAWNHFSHSYRHTVALTNARQYFLIQQDAVNDPESESVPKNCYLESAEIVLDTVGGGATSVLLSVWRDSTGTAMLVGESTVPIVPGGPVASGGAEVSIGKDHHFITGLSVVNAADSTACNLWLGVALNVGTANAKLILNWRW